LWNGIIWILFYLSIKYIIIDSFDNQAMEPFFYDYRNIETYLENTLSISDLDPLKWWIGFDFFSIFLDFFSFFFGFGHLYSDVFGNDEIYYLYNPCNSECEYLEGDIVNKINKEIVMDKNMVYYTKVASLFVVSTFSVVVIYYLTS